MKKPHKKGFIAFTVLALVFTVLLAAAFVLYAMLVLKTDALTVFKGLYLDLEVYKSALKFGLIFESIAWILAALFALLFLAVLLEAILV